MIPLNQWITECLAKGNYSKRAAKAIASQSPEYPEYEQSLIDMGLESAIERAIKSRKLILSNQEHDRMRGQLDLFGLDSAYQFGDTVVRSEKLNLAQYDEIIERDLQNIKACQKSYKKKVFMRKQLIERWEKNPEAGLAEVYEAQCDGVIPDVD